MVNIMHGDCLELMAGIPDGSVDMVLCDLPYGTTQNKWDVIIPFNDLWSHYKRIVKPSAAIVLFGSEPFSSLLRCSNLRSYKYDWIWQKDKATGHLNANKMPMRKTERISVFYVKPCVYNPQIIDKDPKNIRPATVKRNNTGSYGDMSKPSKRSIPIDKSYPADVLNFRGCFGDKGLSNHPTEKPVPLLEYLIKTYTNEGETVLDNCMGSGSTGVACVNTGRDFIGIEMDDKYFEIAEKRILGEVA
jgi:site-specific DNA-methyltransferase (adenine-specific)